MTHSSQVTHALSAMKNERAARGRPEPASLKFLISEDTGGDYRWTLVAASGERLAQSKRFASHTKATRAARIVRAGTASAPIEDCAAALRIASLSDRRTRDRTRRPLTRRSRPSTETQETQHG
jgi:uncharacterized protein YegP (UPF0339 family)